MASYKSLVGVVLAIAALLAAAASAVEDEHMYHWKCFKSCTGSCRDEDDVVVAASGDARNVSASISGGGKCKKRCLDECFEDLPAQCYHQCVVTNCLHLPPFSNDKVLCLKSCCDKCFHPPVPGPGPKPPSPPKPKPPAPKPKPPPAPKPKPPPTPYTPAPSKPKPPAPKPPCPTKPKPKPPPPKKPCPCPPGSDTTTN